MNIPIGWVLGILILTNLFANKSTFLLKVLYDICSSLNISAISLGVLNTCSSNNFIIVALSLINFFVLL